MRIAMELERSELGTQFDVDVERDGQVKNNLQFSNKIYQIHAGINTELRNLEEQEKF